MRIVAIVVALAIVYFVCGRGGEKQSPQSRIAEAQREAAATQPAPTALPPATGNSLRAPMDRTRDVLKLVEKRNDE